MPTPCWSHGGRTPPLVSDPEPCKVVHSPASSLARSNAPPLMKTAEAPAASIRSRVRRSDRAVYIDAFLAAQKALSPDGMFPAAGADTAFRALASIDPDIAKAALDLKAVYTNDFVKAALAKYPGR